jgi:hypothetical protein
LLLLLAGCGGSGSRFGLEQRPVNATCLAPPDGLPPAARLSRTGCADPADPRRPSAGLIPYDVASPLWSDGADKRRFLALPEGAKIDASSAEHWELPVGTVLVKSFLLDGRFIETRLLIRQSQFTWKGYSYEWDEAQTDALLMDEVEGGVKKPVPNSSGSQTWHFPSRAQCLQCHTLAAGVSLGPSARQLDTKTPSSPIPRASPATRWRPWNTSASSRGRPRGPRLWRRRTDRPASRPAPAPTCT